MKKNIWFLAIAQLLILLIILFHYKEFSLLSYINSSFVVGGSLVFIGLISFVFSTGFFDIFVVSMRKTITPKRHMEDVMSMRKPSEVFTANASPLFISGGIILSIMGIALIFYYM